VGPSVFIAPIAYLERLIGSIHRTGLNHFIVLNARHLLRPFLWRFPATLSKAHSSLSPNQLHESFNLLGNLSAVGAEILL
jgi:hypothetical protein